MQADSNAHRRATHISLVGLAVQLALALTFLGYGIFAKDHAGMAAAWAALLGVGVWVGLALVCNQQRRAGREADDAELYANSAAAQATVFEESPEDLQVESKRLAWMYRVLLPAISLALAAGYITIGVTLFLAERGRIGLPLPPNAGWGMSLGIGIAALGFVFARFVAGMAKQAVWSNLRAGAAVAVYASLLGLATAAAYGAAYAGTEIVGQYLGVVIAASMVVVGAEIAMNFVLDFYRPRRQGDAPRPAFDSRILGFAAAPDRLAESVSDAINYQFGFNVSSTWFYRLLSRSFFTLALLGALVLWSMTMIGVVRPDERGVLLRFGRAHRQVDAGWTYKWPWPLERLLTAPALAVNQLDIGSRPATQYDADGAKEAPILWTDRIRKSERLFVVRPSALRNGTGEAVQETADSSGGIALAAIEAPMLYEIVDLDAFLRFAADSDDTDDPDKLRREALQALAERELLAYVGSLSIDQLLLEREAVARELGNRVRKRFADHNTGVALVFVGIAAARPPAVGDVADSFEKMLAAEGLRTMVVVHARAEAAKELAEAAGSASRADRIVAALDKLEQMRTEGADAQDIATQQASIEAMLEQGDGPPAGRAAELLAEARAGRWTKHMDRRGEATRHEGRLALYQAAPTFYMVAIYLETIADLAAESRVFITGSDPVVELNFEEIESIGSFSEESN